MCLAEVCLRVFHLAFLLGNLVNSTSSLAQGSRRVKKVRIFRAWFSHGSGAVSALEPLERKPFSRLRSEELVLRLCFL